MVFRRRSASPPGPLVDVDPSRVPRAYRPPVADALRARAQFAELLAGMRAGPLRDRMGELGGRIDAGVLAVWRTATQAAQVDRVVGMLDLERVTAELKQGRRAGASDEVVAALQERFTSMQRLLNSRDELGERLPVLEARLGTAVARAAELALTSPASASTEIVDLAAELDQLVVELDSFSAAGAELA